MSDLTDIKIDFQKTSVYLKKHTEIIAGVFAYIRRKILWCDPICVENTFQNKGLGGQLISKLSDIASTHTLREIQLNTYFLDWKCGGTCYLMRSII